MCLEQFEKIEKYKCSFAERIYTSSKLHIVSIVSAYSKPILDNNSKKYSVTSNKQLLIGGEK